MATCRSTTPTSPKYHRPGASCAGPHPLERIAAADCQGASVRVALSVGEGGHALVLVPNDAIYADAVQSDDGVMLA